MIYLVLASLLWGTSFPIIKYELAKAPFIVVLLIRFVLAVIPLFIRVKKVKSIFKIPRLLLIAGLLQFYFMYFFYLQSYQFLSASALALNTLITPLWIVLFEGIIKRTNIIKSFSLCLINLLVLYWATAKNINNINLGSLRGFFFIQLSDICFAAGLVCFTCKATKYKGAKLTTEQYMLASYLLTILFAGLHIIFATDVTFQNIAEIFSANFLVLLYLGFIPTSLAFYFWLKGATLVPNLGIVAIMNNTKIPCAILIAYFAYSEPINWSKTLTVFLTIGVSSIILNKRPKLSY